MIADDKSSHMDPAVATTPASAPPPAFEDGLGERRHTVGAGNEPLEVLRVSTVLSAVSSFEFALRERAGRLASFRHPSYGRVRAVERLDKLASTLVVVSEHTPGLRLSELLARAEKRSLKLEVDAARCLIRQLVTAVAALHESVPDTCHGALGPERIIVKPDGRVVIVEYVLGAALEQLRYSQDRYWRELGVALPTTAGPVRFDPNTDVTQVGTVVLSLLLGRRLRSDEYPAAVEGLILSATMRLSPGALGPPPTNLRDWLLRSLQLDPHGSFASAVEARADLDSAIGQAKPGNELAALESFLLRCAQPEQQQARADVDVVAPAPVTSESVPETSVDTIDPSAGLEALRSFLNRYPSREAERPLVRPAVGTDSVDLAPVAAARVATPVPPAVPAQNRAQPQPPAPTAAPGKAEPVSPTLGAPPQFATPPQFGASPQFTASSQFATPPQFGASPQFTASPQFAMPAVASVKAEHTLTPQVAAPATVTTTEWTWPRYWWVGSAIVLIALTTGATLLGLWYITPIVDVEPKGTLVVGTNPGGVPVLIDGTRRGVTPLSVDLPVGDHVIELVTEAGNRKIPVRLSEGGQVSQFIELPRVAGTVGSLLVRTDPVRAEVVIDGKRLGRAPLTVPDLSPGQHTVVLESESGSLTQQVTIVPDSTASLIVSMTKAQNNTNSAGWISVAAPADVQVYEGQRLLGTNRSDRIMLPVGRHDLEIVNEALGYRTTRTVEVQAGQVATVKAEWPQGSLSLNATPWAEVWIDGERIGETPIGSVQVPIGTHEIIFRHPELGERRASATVTLGAPARVGVDLRSK